MFLCGCVKYEVVLQVRSQLKRRQRVGELLAEQQRLKVELDAARTQRAAIGADSKDSAAWTFERECSTNPHTQYIQQYNHIHVTS